MLLTLLSLSAFLLYGRISGVPTRLQFEFAGRSATLRLGPCAEFC